MRITLAAPITVEADDGAPRRTISGIAVPWNVTAEALTGPVRFEAGSLPTDGPAPKLIRDHDLSQPIGIVTARTVTDDGMTFTARISATSAGDEALTLAADGVLDAVSVGVDVLRHRFDDGVLVVEAGRWRELSLVPFGAFEEAKIAQVAAAESAPDPSDEEDPPTTTTSEEETMETTVPAAEAATPTAPIYIAASSKKIPSAAEYIAAMADPVRFAVMAADMDTGDTPGILPVPIVGPVYDGLAADRPLTTAVGTRAMPRAGKVFIRPVVTTRTAVAEQDDELDELASQAMVVTDETVTKKTYGGFVRLSEQAIDWTDPAVLNLVIGDLAREYARQTETVACGALEAASNTEDNPDFTDAQEVLEAIYDAAATINSNTGMLPTHLFVSPDRWADLGKLVTSGGNLLFPTLNPSSAAGSLNAASTTGNPLNLSLVVSWKFSDETFIVGNARGIEFYEDQKGSISVEDPSHLGRIIAWRGYFATLLIDDDMFVKYTDPE